MEQQNPIFKFFSENKLTDLDEKSFLNAYSKPEKAKEIHSFMVENKLTDLDESKFFDQYLKKKEPAGFPISSGQSREPKIGFPTSPAEGLKAATQLESTKPIGNIDIGLIKNYENAQQKRKEANSHIGLTTIKLGESDDVKDQLTADAAKANELAAPQIDELANRLLSKYKIDEFVDKGGKPNVERIDQFSRNVARTYNLPETGYFYNQLKTKIEAKATYKELISDESFMQEFKNNYKLNTGKDYVDPNVKTKEVESVVSDGIIRADLIQKDISKTSKSEIDAYSSQTFLPETKKINDTYKATTDQIKQQAGNDPEAKAMFDQMYQAKRTELEQAVMSGTMSAGVADGILQSKELKDQVSKVTNDFLNKKYKPAFDEAYKKYSFERTEALNKMIAVQNEVTSKANARYKRQIDEVKKEVDLKLDKFKGSKEEQEKVAKAWTQAIETTSSRRNIEKGIKEDKGMFGSVLGKSTLSSFGRMIKSTAEAFDSPDLALWGRTLEESYKTASNPTEKFSDLFDPSKAARLTGNLFGSMIPSVITGSAIAYSTRGNLSLAGRIVLTGISGFVSETPAIVGEAYSSVLARTGSEAKAKGAADKAFTSQLYALPTYMIDGLKYFPSALKKIPFLGKTVAGRVLTGATSEYLTEVAQEYPQTLFEDAYMNDKDLSEAFNSKWFDTLKNTALQVAPTALMGGSGPALSYFVSEPIQKRMGQSFAASQDLSGLIPEQKSQFFAKLALTKSAAYTNAVLSTMLASGNITQEEFDNMAPYIANMEENRQVILDAKRKGANTENQIFLGHLLSEQSKLAGQVEQDPSLQPQLDEINNRISSISKGLNEDLYVIQYKDKSWFSFDAKTFESLMNDENFVKKLKNKEVTIGLSFKEKAKATAQTVAIFEKLYGIKPPPAVESAPSLSDKVLDETQRAELDQKVKDFQEKTGYKPDELTVDDNTGITLDRLSMGIPVDNVAVEEASTALYQRYKQYEAMLNASSRLMTTEQIKGLMSQLEEKITRLENVKNGKDFNTEITTEASTVAESNNQTGATEVSAEPQAIKSYADSLSSIGAEQRLDEDTVEGFLDNPIYSDIIAAAKAEGISADKVIKDLYKKGAFNNIETREELEMLDGQIKRDIGAKPEPVQDSQQTAEPIDEFVEANYTQIMADLKLKNRVQTSGCGY